MNFRTTYLLAAIVLGACATSPNVIAPPPAKTLAALEVSDWGEALRDDLRGSLGKTGVLSDASIGVDGAIQLALNSDASFETNSAQLRVSALEPYARISTVYNRHPGSVLHVLVSDSGDSDLEPAARLAARRAASLRHELELAGVPTSRLRAEGRAPVQGAKSGLRLVFSPVVKGREAHAWVAPPKGR